MQRKTILGLAVRIIAVLLIIGVLRDLVQTIGFVLSSLGQEGYEQNLQYILMFLSPVFMLMIAVALLKSADGISEKVYPVEIMGDMDEVGLFTLAMKVTGLILMVWAIPDLIQIISNFYYISYLAPSISHWSETLYIVDHLARSLVSVLLGWYLLKDGRFFSKMAFGQEKMEDPE